MKKTFHFLLLVMIGFNAIAQTDQIPPGTTTPLSNNFKLKNSNDTVSRELYINWGTSGSILRSDRIPRYYDLQTKFLAKMDSVNNNGYVTHGYFNSHATVFTGSNGITLDGNDFKLGGALAETTIINTNSQIFFAGQLSSNPFYLGVDPTLGPGLFSNGDAFHSNITSAPSGDIGIVTQRLSDNSLSSFNINRGVISITDEVNNRGVTYGGSYMANATDNTLITKRYADSVAGAAVDTSLLIHNRSYPDYESKSISLNGAAVISGPTNVTLIQSDVIGVLKASDFSNIFRITTTDPTNTTMGDYNNNVPMQMLSDIYSHNAPLTQESYARIKDVDSVVFSSTIDTSLFIHNKSYPDYESKNISLFGVATSKQSSDSGFGFATIGETQIGALSSQGLLIQTLGGIQALNINATPSLVQISAPSSSVIDFVGSEVTGSIPPTTLSSFVRLQDIGGSVAPVNGFAAKDSTFNINKNLFDVQNKVTARNNLGIIDYTNGAYLNLIGNVFDLNTNVVDARYLRSAGGNLTGSLNSQTILPSANSTYTLGNSSFRYSQAYINTILSSQLNVSNINSQSFDLTFRSGSTNVQWGKLFESTGNFQIQTGGTLTDAGYKLDVQGTLRSTGALSLDNPKTTVSGSNSGNATFSQPLQGASYKKVMVYCNSFSGTASYTFPTTFTNTPAIVITNGPPASIVTSLSKTAMTVTGSATTGYIILEGY